MDGRERSELTSWVRERGTFISLERAGSMAWNPRDESFFISLINKLSYILLFEFRL